MDLATIETFLKDTIWGIVLLSALGSGLLLLILNLIGRANKGIKWLRQFYKDGITTTTNELYANENRFELFKYKSNRKFWMAGFLLVPMFMCLLILSVVDSMNILFGFLGFLNGVLWALVHVEMGIIKKVHLMRMYDEGEENHND